MILYHTSNVKVLVPDTLHSRNDIDFGRGFYLTTIQSQAVNYAQRFLRREEEAWLNTFQFEHIPSEWKVLQFDAYDRGWLDFISKCRAGEDDTDFDLVIGGIANDKVVRTLDRYFKGEISAEQALGLLKYEKPNIQYCIRSQAMLDQCLTHIESTRL